MVTVGSAVHALILGLIAFLVVGIIAWLVLWVIGFFIAEVKVHRDRAAGVIALVVALLVFLTNIQA